MSGTRDHYIFVGCTTATAYVCVYIGVCVLYVSSRLSFSLARQLKRCTQRRQWCGRHIFGFFGDLQTVLKRAHIINNRKTLNIMMRVMLLLSLLVGCNNSDGNGNTFALLRCAALCVSIAFPPAFPPSTPQSASFVCRFFDLNERQFVMRFYCAFINLIMAAL